MIFSVTVGTAILCCLIFIVKEIVQRIQKQKAYSTESFGIFLIRIILIPAIVLFLATLLGRHKGIPVILILLTVVVLVYTYITQNTVPGRYLYAMGGNERAAKLSGIDTNKALFLYM